MTAMTAGSRLRRPNENNAPYKTIQAHEEYHDEEVQ